MRRECDPIGHRFRRPLPSVRWIMATYQSEAVIPLPIDKNYGLLAGHRSSPKLSGF